MEIGDGAKVQTLTLQEAVTRGYSIFFEKQKLSIQMPFNAIGVTDYVVGVNLLVPPPKHRPVFLSPNVLSTVCSYELRIQLI